MIAVYARSGTGASKPVVYSSTVQAGPNIAVAKYWGKRDGVTCAGIEFPRCYNNGLLRIILTSMYLDVSSRTFELADKCFSQFHAWPQVRQYSKSFSWDVKDATGVDYVELHEEVINSFICIQNTRNSNSDIFAAKSMQQQP